MKQLFSSKYVSTLEEEVSRLRAENRALMNSLLGTAGFPPVEFPAPLQPVPLSRLRKRSWHQLQALRESEAKRDASVNFDERANGSAQHS